MKFYALHGELYQGIQSRLRQSKSACDDFQIEFIALDSLSVDYANLPKLSETDLLYNVARGTETLETLLLNKDVITFYVSNPEFIANQFDTTKYSILHDKLDIPSPKTVYYVTQDRNLIKKYVEYLGGFPLVVKAKGGTLGVGTIISNDFASLFSLVDFLVSTKVEFILRQFIDYTEAARLIVIGDKVVASNQKFIADSDFRTSVKEKLTLPKIYSQEVQDIAVKASRASNFENTGVDILFDKHGKPYLLEVNTPHDFVTTSDVTGIDIAKLMVDYLIEKSKTVRKLEFA